MNLVLLEDGDFLDDSCVQLKGRRHRHIQRILRVRVGDEITVGHLGGPIGRGRVERLEADSVTLAVNLDREPPRALPITLVLALPRPPVLRRLLAGVTAMGLKHVALLDSAAVEKSFWQSHSLAADAIREQLCLGLEQSRDTILPQVELHRDFDAFVDQALPELLEDKDGYLAHPDSVSSRKTTGPALLAVGPEGGWTEPEQERLTQAGLLPFGLGTRALRVEMAVPALLARLL